LIHYASEYSSIEIIQLLSATNVLHKDDSGETALHCATRRSSEMFLVVKHLIDLGCDINDMNYDDKSTLDMLLEANNSPGTVDYLFKNNFIRNEESKIKLLWQLVSTPSLANVKLFEHHGGNINMINENGTSVLEYILNKRLDFECIDYMFSKNYIQDDESKTKILLQLVSNLTLQNIERFEKYGGDFDLQNERGMNLLHIACRQKTHDIDLFQYLIDVKKIDVNAQDEDGWTPFHCICKYGTVESIDYFLTKGVDVNILTNKYNGSDANFSPITILDLNNNIGDENKNELIEYLVQFISVC